MKECENVFVKPTQRVTLLRDAEIGVLSHTERLK